MLIRSATDQDIPAIVDLLKLSLGESLMPKSEAFWRWKHVNNPFGKSPILLAFDGHQLIGVRAFLRWNWRIGDKIYRSARAVDTATHPLYQGRGIFKKLTLQMLEYCRDEDVDFIFNTPNGESKPGYLKMGWQDNGRLHIAIRPVLPWRVKSKQFEIEHSIKNFDFKFHLDLEKATSMKLRTEWTQQFLEWRYGNNPNIGYYVVKDNNDPPTYLTIFRLKPHRFGTEFRICDSYLASNVDLRQYHKHHLDAVKSSGANLISSSDNLRFLSSLLIPIGPSITTHALSFDYNYLNFKLWKPSLGDMEVF